MADHLKSASFCKSWLLLSIPVENPFGSFSFEPLWGSFLIWSGLAARRPFSKAPRVEHSHWSVLLTWRATTDRIGWEAVTAGNLESDSMESGPTLSTLKVYYVATFLVTNGQKRFVLMWIYVYRECIHIWMMCYSHFMGFETTFGRTPRLKQTVSTQHRKAQQG